MDDFKTALRRLLLDPEDAGALGEITRELTRRGLIDVDEMLMQAMISARQHVCRTMLAAGARRCVRPCFELDETMDTVNLVTYVTFDVGGRIYGNHVRRSLGYTLKHGRAEVMAGATKALCEDQHDWYIKCKAETEKRSPALQYSVPIAQDTPRPDWISATDVVVTTGDDAVTLERGRPIGEPAAHQAFQDYLNEHVIRDEDGGGDDE